MVTDDNIKGDGHQKVKVNSDDQKIKVNGDGHQKVEINSDGHQKVKVNGDSHHNVKVSSDDHQKVKINGDGHHMEAQEGQCVVGKGVANGRDDDSGEEVGKRRARGQKRQQKGGCKGEDEIEEEEESVVESEGNMEIEEKKPEDLSAKTEEVPLDTPVVSILGNHGVPKTPPKRQTGKSTFVN